MMHVFLAEWEKLMRKGVILGGGGVLVGLAMLATLVIFSQAQEEPSEVGPGLRTTTLEKEAGLVEAWAVASQIVGAVSLVLFARSVTNEYARGTLKVALIREPRRWVFLGGKFLAMAAFVAGVAFAAGLASLVIGVSVAAARGLDLSAWWTAEGFGGQVLGLLRFQAAVLVWGLFGLALGTIFRSAAALATGLGIGVIFVGGHLLERFWDDAAQWLPSLVLSTFTVGGNADLSLGTATLVVVSYAVVLGATSLFAFLRGDVAV